MIKTLTNLFKQDKEKFVVPKGVQDVIPIKAIYDDGIFQVGKDKFSKSFKFTDINYAVAMLPQMTGRQRYKANALIKRLCANYDGGNCLLLDDGEPCVCVQSISYSRFANTSAMRYCPQSQSWKQRY